MNLCFLCFLFSLVVQSLISDQDQFNEEDSVGMLPVNYMHGEEDYHKESISQINNKEDDIGQRLTFVAKPELLEPKSKQPKR